MQLLSKKYPDDLDSKLLFNVGNPLIVEFERLLIISKEFRKEHEFVCRIFFYTSTSILLFKNISKLFG